MKLPENVDKGLLAVTRTLGDTPADLRRDANNARELGRSLMGINEARAEMYMRQASRLKRVAQYLERGGV